MLAKSATPISDDEMAESGQQNDQIGDGDAVINHGVDRVWRLMKRAGIKAQVGYRSPRTRKGEVSIVTPNRLQRQFNPKAPDERWVTDITYIRTHEGWLYLAVVVDLFSRKVIGWSMQPRMTKDIILNALLYLYRPIQSSQQTRFRL
ncbi:transposase [Escherichia coli]|nr:Integrase catalytic subunit [Klebsiella michiganensis]EOW20579.1 hypothetical protein A1WU_03309 [Escherichia coli KTE108]SQO48642.1 transposase insF for insertion sequence IS3A/B/C/D/E/fA [Escherichia coli]KZT45732.1 integrase [Klebsiella michiganensis]GCU32791.1 transposase [Escherichia coli]